MSQSVRSSTDSSSSVVLGCVKETTQGGVGVAGHGCLSGITSVSVSADIKSIGMYAVWIECIFEIKQLTIVDNCARLKSQKIDLHQHARFRH